MERLLINRTGVNPSTGKEIIDHYGERVVGSFFLKSDPNKFEKEVMFRPIVAWPRYFIYDPKLGRYDGETIYIRQLWNEELGKYVTEEPIDNKGGLMLGRPKAAELAALPDWQQEAIRKRIKWQVCIFGIAYLPGQTEGKAVEFCYSGRKGVELLDFLNKGKKPWYQSLYSISLRKNGDHLQPDFKLIQKEYLKEMDVDLQEFLKLKVKEVYDYVESVNSRIREQHEAAVVSEIETKPKKVAEKIRKIPPQPLTELDDEIPY